MNQNSTNIIDFIGKKDENKIIINEDIKSISITQEHYNENMNTHRNLLSTNKYSRDLIIDNIVNEASIRVDNKRNEKRSQKRNI